MYLSLIALTANFSNLLVAEQAEVGVKLYRQLRIIMALNNQGIRILLPVAKFLYIIPSVCATYAVVRLERIVSLFCGAYALATTRILEIALNALAEQDVRSQKLLRVLKASYGDSDKKIYSAKRNGCRHANCHYTGEWHIFCRQGTRSHCSAYIIATNTVNILLM